MLKQILNISWKELIQLSRDKRMYPILIIAPVIQLILLGYAATFDIENLPLAVNDKSRSSLSREYLDKFKSSSCFKIRMQASDEKVEEEIMSGRAKLGLNIPPDFQRKIKRMQTTYTQLIIDGSDSNTGVIAANYARIISQKFSLDLLKDKKNNIPVDFRLRVWYNPELKSRNFMVPAVIVMILLITTMMLSGMSMVKEKETGTMESLIVTPIKPLELIIGKLIPFISIAYFNLTLVVLVGIYWFGVPFKGSFLLLFLLSGIFLLTTLGLGLFISTISQNQQQAMMTAFFLMLPLSILSGFMFPISSMPVAVQYLTYLNPLRYFLVIIRGIFLKANGIDILWSQALALFVLGFTIITLSSRRFRKKLG